MCGLNLARRSSRSTTAPTLPQESGEKRRHRHRDRWFRVEDGVVARAGVDDLMIGVAMSRLPTVYTVVLMFAQMLYLVTCLAAAMVPVGRIRLSSKDPSPGGCAATTPMLQTKSRWALAALGR